MLNRQCAIIWINYGPRWWRSCIAYVCFTWDNICLPDLTFCIWWYRMLFPTFACVAGTREALDDNVSLRKGCPRASVHYAVLHCCVVISSLGGQYIWILPTRFTLELSPGKHRVTTISQSALRIGDSLGVGRRLRESQTTTRKRPCPDQYSFTVPMDSIRAVQSDCHGGLKNDGNSHWSREPIMQLGTRQSQSIFRPTNHKSLMPANWRPYLIPHWQSYRHQARTV